MTAPNGTPDPTQPGYQEPGYQQSGYQEPGFQQGGYQPPAPPQAGYQQAGYPAPGYQQPAYQQPGYPPPAGYPAAGPYGGAGGYVPAGPARPGMVTAAAILSFIWGGFSIVWALIAGFIGALISVFETACTTATEGAGECSTGGAGVGAIFVAIGLIVVAGLLIAGGVQALAGKSNKLATIASGILVLLFIIAMAAIPGGIFFGIFGIVVPVLIGVFLLHPTSKQWFQTKGGKTF